MFARWLEPIRKQIPQDITAEESAALSDAILQEALRRFNAFLTGVQVYQSHPASREVGDDVEIVWQDGTTRLLDYAPASKGAVVFVVPSLVNRFDILDVDQDHSFLRHLTSQGLRPLVVDWGELGEVEQKFSLSDYMTERLLPLLDIVKEKAGGQPCHVLGYCMGGVMALSLALMREKDIASLTLMATPWDFAVKGVAGVPSYDTWAGQMFAKQADMVLPHIDKMGFLPPSFLQSIFTTYQPLQILQKYMGFANLGEDDARTRRFVLTEDWLNSGVALSLPVAKECMNAWYKENQTGKLKWRVAGIDVDPRKLNLPTYLLIPKRDRIVPPESALPLQNLISNTTVHEPDMGHIGVMAGDAAAQKVWSPLVAWIKNQN